MKSSGFIKRSLAYYRKQHFGVFLASLISTAVLTGALTIGDSVKLSLKSIVDNRLGNIEHVLTTGNRYFKSDLSSRITKDLNIPAASVLQLNGIVVFPGTDKRLNNVQITGINNEFVQGTGMTIPELAGNEVVISKNASDKLGIKTGDELLIKINNEGIVPGNAPFTSDNDQILTFRVVVNGIVGFKQGGSFSLKNNQSSPANIFINRDYLAEKTELTGYSNMIIMPSVPGIEETKLNNTLSNVMRLADYNLQLKKVPDSPYLQLVSNRVFIDKPLTGKIKEIDIPKYGILTYFANSIKSGENETPYSFVSAIPDGFFTDSIGENEIVVNSWLAQDLDIVTGDTIEMEYFLIGRLGSLTTNRSSFVVKEIIPLEESELQKSLMPDFPGLSDAGNCSDWEAGIPIDLKKIRKEDEDYWDSYRGTPKAYISLDKGIKLWENKFGRYSGFMFDSLVTSQVNIESQILDRVIPSDVGFTFINARTTGNDAAENGVDFGELFLSLSFFIIVSALLLTILVTSLNIKRREYETGVLKSLGFSRKKIFRLRFYESLPTLAFASIAGGLAGIGYNELMLFGLNTIWNDALHSGLIYIHILPSTLITGIVIGFVTSLLSVYFTTRRSLKQEGINIIRKSSVKKKNNNIPVKILAISGTTGSIVITAYLMASSGMENASLLLTAGFLFLTGCVSAIYIAMGSRFKRKTELPVKNKWQLAKENTRLNRNRNIAIVSLLAIGTFTIIVTGANRLTFSEAENQRKSGTGGFQLWVENSVPFTKELNTESGKEFYSLSGEKDLEGVFFMQLSKLMGDDASCLNLNQVQQPAIIGVNPYLMDSLGAFTFSNRLSGSPNPWLDLTKQLDNNTFPAIADQTVIQWGLMKSLGDTLKYMNEQGDIINLVLVGGLAPSVFQGNIIISNEHLLSNFPDLSGSALMLVETDADKSEKVTDLLYTYLEDYGISITTTSDRLLNFYSVTNTYLSIFMILGGMGVIIGTIGLSLVLVRNLIERRNEIAIYYAIGFKKSQIFNVIFLENFLLLITGMTTGILASAIAILPSVLSTNFSISNSFVFVLILMVLLSGLLWIYIPLKTVLKTKPLKHLRTE